MTRRRWLILSLLLVLLVGSGIVAWQTPAPAKLPAAAWNSSWVFAAEVFVGFFVAVFLLAVIIVGTVIEERPPGKLSFGLLAYESDFKKATQALAEGGTALQAVEAEARTAQDAAAAGLTAARHSLEGVIQLAGALPDSEEIATRARKQLAALPAPATPDRSRSEFAEAMARFDQLVAQLEALPSRREDRDRG